MDFSERITALRQKKTKLLEQVDALAEKGDNEGLNNIRGEMEGINATIASLEALAGESAGRAAPKEEKEEKKAVTPFASFGEQLRAVYDAAHGLGTDPRLIAVNNALGASEGIGSDGGFAVQEDFAGSIFETAAGESEILSRVDRYRLSSAANAARWLMIDETDVSASVFGGVQAYWAAEAATVTASRPKFREMRLELEKMMGFAYVTEELISDAPFMSALLSRAFTTATRRLLEESIVSGDGAGKPLGILNSEALVTVSKESGQTAGTVTTQNILKMNARAPFRNRRNLVWLMHPDLEEQLPTLTIGDKLVWMPEGGISGNPYQTILSRPVLFDDNCSAMGAAGDIMLCDLSQYMLLTKGNPRQDWSIHVQFLTDQQCFRIVWRVNGAPKANRGISIKNSSNKRSPFVTLAARS